MFDAVVTRSEADEVEGRIILAHELRPQAPQLVLYQGLAKRERMDLVVQKAVELGARQIVPFAAGRSVVKWDSEKKLKSRERWEAVALAASKQCRSPWLTEIEAVADSLSGLDSTSGPVLVLHEEATVHLRDVLPEQAPARLTIVIGPEGGLDPSEVEMALSAGAQAVTLGGRILRTETAGPVALALVAYTYGVLG